jgi:hypothetical protein
MLRLKPKKLLVEMETLEQRDIARVRCKWLPAIVGENRKAAFGTVLRMKVPEDFERQIHRIHELLKLSHDNVTWNDRIPDTQDLPAALESGARA